MLGICIGDVQACYLLFPYTSPGSRSLLIVFSNNFKYLFKEYLRLLNRTIFVNYESN